VLAVCPLRPRLRRLLLLQLLPGMVLPLWRVMLPLLLGTCLRLRRAALWQSW
jgi:hypothetical protein